MTRWKTWAMVIGMGSLGAPAMALAQQGGAAGTQNQPEVQPGAPSEPGQAGQAPSQQAAPGAGDSNQGMQQPDTSGSSTVNMSDLPAAVQRTFKQEAKGNQLQDIKKTRDLQGNTVFQAEIVKGKQGVDIQVAPDGTLIKKSAPHSDIGQGTQP